MNFAWSFNRMDRGKNRAFLLLGGNLGNVLETIGDARKMISENAGNIVRSSHVYKSAPWGFESTDFFLNQVVEVETWLGPESLLQKLLIIESALGRKRTHGKIDSRTIDIDILLFNNLIMKTESLEIPHPRFHLRRFALVPLTEVAREHVHPGLGKTIGQLLEVCTDNSNVISISENLS